MIYLLAGPDTYRSRERLRAIEREFTEKTGALLSVQRIDAEESGGDIRNVGRSASLFSPKTLLIIERFLKLQEPEVRSLKEVVPAWAKDPNLTVVFWDAELPKSDATVAFITKHAAKTQVFETLNGERLRQWVKAEAASRKIPLQREQEALIADLFDGDLWKISNELEKLSAGGALAKEQEIESNIWLFVDRLLKGERGAAIELERELASGSDPIMVLAAAGSSLRNLALISWGQRTGTMERAARSMHPFAVKKASLLANAIRPSRIRELYDAFIQADVGAKTGFPAPYALFFLALSRADGR